MIITQKLENLLNKVIDYKPNEAPKKTYQTAKQG